MITERFNKVRSKIRLYRRQAWADQNQYAFRLGYNAALDDIERTGLIPKDSHRRRSMADHALKRIVER